MKNRFVYRFFIAFLLFVPFHYWICEILLPNTQVDNFIRDSIIIALFIYVLVKGILLTDITIILICIDIIILFYCLCSILNGNNAYAVLNATRVYIVPPLIYIVSSNLNFDHKQVQTIQKLIVSEFVTLAAWGIFQALVLGDDFLIKIGYTGENGFLSDNSFYISGFYGYQRVNSVFVSPNIYAIICTIVLSLALLPKLFRSSSLKILGFFILVCSLILSFSRSAIFAFISAYIICYILKHKIAINKILYIVISFVVFLLIFFYIDISLLDNQIYSMVTRSFLGIFNGTDSSAMRHFSDLVQPLETIFQHPFGLGLGTNGPLALGTIENPHLVESSIYLMIYELGFIGVIMFAPFLKIIFNRRAHFISRLISLTCIINFFFLPNIQTFDVIFFYYLVIGLFDNQSEREYLCAN